MTSPPTTLEDKRGSRKRQRTAGTVSTKSTRTKRSSRLTFQELDVEPDGLIREPLGELESTNIPPRLREFLARITPITLGHGVVALALKAELDKLSPPPRNLTDVAYMPPSSMTEQFVPDFQRVCRIRLLACECVKYNQDEADWNAMVHFPILDMALPQTNELGWRVRARPCTTARILPEYVHKTSEKLIDFCLFLEPSAIDTDFEGAVERARKYRPGHSINHTNSSPLCHRPIFISIKSKKAGGSLTDAELQLGTWMASQWSALETLSPDTALLPPFLPALVIQGNHWSLVYTTRHGKQTRLWITQPLGSSDTLLGIFQIICGIRYLARWGLTVYLPIFERLLSVDSNLSIRDEHDGREGRFTDEATVSGQAETD